MLGWLTAGVGFAFAAEPAATVAERVVILANSREADSVRLARYYAERRAVPPANIVALPMSPDETIEWAQFVDEIHRPTGQPSQLGQRKLKTYSSAPLNRPPRYCSASARPSRTISTLEATDWGRCST